MHLRVRGINLGVEVRGAGETILLVHGSWTDRNDWGVVTPRLARAFRTVAVDRRGHGESDRVPGTVRDDVLDLAAVLEELGPAHVVGSSFGGTLALQLAALHPERVLSVAVHEPPLVPLARGSPDFDSSVSSMEETAARVHAGDLEGAARGFVESVAYAPGAWERLHPNVRATMVRNARTWLEEKEDPEVFRFEPERLAGARILVSHGDQSPAFFRTVARELARLLPHARTKTFAGAGHVPHLTLPRETAVTIAEFARV